MSGRLFIRDEKLVAFSVPLKLILTEPGLDSPPANALVSQWFFDTGYDGDAFAWREHILTAGLNPDVERDFRGTWITSSLSNERTQMPIRKADLWLVGNLDQDAHYPLRLRQGVAFRDEPIAPQTARAARPLIGMRLFARAKLRIDLDSGKQTFSIWIPHAG